MSTARLGGNFPSGGHAAAGLTAAVGQSGVMTIDSAIQSLYSTLANEIVKSLNFLLAKTSDITSDGNSIQIELHPALLTAIVDLLDVINPVGNLIFVDKTMDSDQNDAMIIDEIFDTISTRQYSWKKLIGSKNDEVKFLARYLDDNVLLLSLLGIIRNLSVETTNEIFLAYHTSLMRHLVSILEASMLIGKFFEATQLALESLVFIGGRIELTGSKRLLSSSSYFLEELPTDSVGGALLRLRMTPAMSSSTSELYEIIMNEMIQIVYLMINHETTHSRLCAIKGMELFSKLVQCSDNRNYFSKLPIEVMQSLFRLLYVQVTKSETLVHDMFSLMGDPLGRSRPPYVPAITNVQGDNVLTFFHDQVDVDFRDMALNEIRTLCQISRFNAINFISIHGGIDLLFQIANFRGTGGASLVVIRNECSNKAIGILSNLAQIPEAFPQFQALRTEVIAAGCADNYLADILCNATLHMMFPAAAAAPPRGATATQPSF